jgi:hypothetical protein
MSGRMLKVGGPHLADAGPVTQWSCGFEEEAITLVEDRLGQTVCAARRSQRMASNEGGEVVGAADVEGHEVESKAAIGLSRHRRHPIAVDAHINSADFV